VGPSLLCATGSLTVANNFARTLTTQLIAAFAGSLIGLALGFALVVYVLGVW
jgi:di/tricarboxylate transporter